MCTLCLFIIKVCVYVYLLTYWNIFIVQIKPALRHLFAGKSHEFFPFLFTEPFLKGN